MQNQNMNNPQDQAGEMPEMKQLDSLISKIQQMKQSGQVDIDEILMDLEDYKSMCNGEDTSEPINSGDTGMAGMIDKMSMGGK